MSKYKLILFDLDGTLINTKKGIILTFKYIFDKYKITLPESFDINTIIGPPLYRTFSERFQFSGDELLEIIKCFRDYYSQNNIFIASPYDKMDYVLNELKNNNYILGVATNKNEEHAYRVLNHFDIEKYFDYISGSNSAETMQKKDIIKTVLLNSNTDTTDALMIGDSKADLEGAVSNNVDFLAATYGYGFPDEKSLIDNNIKYHIDKPIELLSFLEIK